MVIEPRVYPLAFASGATSTNSAHIGNATRVYLYHSGTTAFNAGTGNMGFNLCGSIGTNQYQSALSGFRILSAVIQTDISGGIYNWPVSVGGIPRMYVEFGTAVSANASGLIYLIVGQD